MMKRFLTFLIFVLLLTVRLFAQEVGEAKAVQQDVERNKRMKIGGTTLTVLGSMLLIAGAVRTQYNPDDIPLDPRSERFIFGIGGIVLGGAGLRLGIPMLMKSANPERKDMIEMHHYKAGKVVGPLLTIGGGACLIIGAAKHARVISSEVGNSDAAAAMLLVGVTSVATGLPIWISSNSG